MSEPTLDTNFVQDLPDRNQRQEMNGNVSACELSALDMDWIDLVYWITQNYDEKVGEVFIIWTEVA